MRFFLFSLATAAFWLTLSPSSVDAFVMKPAQSSFVSQTGRFDGHIPLLVPNLSSVVTTTSSSSTTSTTTKLFMMIMPTDFSNPRSTTQEAIEEQYVQWCRKFGKPFDPMKLPAFKQNLEAMQRYSKDTNQPMEMNEYSDMTRQEYNSMMGIKEKPNNKWKPQFDENGEEIIQIGSDYDYRQGRSPRDKAPNTMSGTNMQLQPPSSPGGGGGASSSSDSRNLRPGNVRYVRRSSSSYNNNNLTP